MATDYILKDQTISQATRRGRMLAVALAAFLGAPYAHGEAVSPATGDDRAAPAAQARVSLLGRWRQRIAARLPERTLVETYDRLARQTRESADNLLGNMALTLRHETDAYTDDLGKRSWEAGIDFPLKALGQRKAFRALAEQYPTLSERHTRWLDWQAAGIARDLYGELLELRILRDHAREAERQAARLHELVTLRESAGDASRLDSLLSSRNLNQTRIEAVAAQARLRKGLALAATWGIDLDEEDLPKADADSRPTSELDADQDGIIRRHPRYLWIEASNAVASAQTELALWESRASNELFFGGKQDRADGAPDEASLVFQLRIPLGESPGYRRATAEAAQQRRQRQTELARVKQELTQTLIESRQSLIAARKLLPLARQQAETTRQALALSRQNYEAGEIGLQDLLIVQKEHLQAQLELALAKARSIRAYQQLNQAAGILP